MTGKWSMAFFAFLPRQAPCLSPCSAPFGGLKHILLLVLVLVASRPPLLAEDSTNGSGPCSATKSCTFMRFTPFFTRIIASRNIRFSCFFLWSASC